MNSFDLQLKKHLRALTLLHEYGWLRARELGMLMWPENSSASEAANTLVRDLEKRKLVLVRELPQRAGKAAVLAIAGVRLLAEHDYQAKTGKDIGTMTKEGWIPPHSWKHDLIAVGVLAEFSKRGYSVIPEQTLRRLPTDSPKLPDGLVCGPDGHWIWLEVEHALKTGKNRKNLAVALSLAAAGKITTVGGKSCTRAMLAYTDAIDNRGHALNHKKRAITAISEHTNEPVEVLFAHCEIAGASVKTIRLTAERIEPEKMLRVLRTLNAGGWHPHTEADGVQFAVYGRHTALVWEGEHGPSYQVDDKPANYADTLAEAKKACAREIAKLSA